MMLWNRKYQEFDLVVSSVTTKVKGVAQTYLPGIGDMVWDVVDYNGPSQVGARASDLWVLGLWQRGEFKYVCFFFLFRAKTPSLW